MQRISTLVIVLTHCLAQKSKSLLFDDCLERPFVSFRAEFGYTALYFAILKTSPFSGFSLFPLFNAKTCTRVLANAFFYYYYNCS